MTDRLDPRPLVLLLACLVFAPEAGAQAYFADNGRAVFRSSVPLHSFDGVSNSLTGRISVADSTVDFYLDLTTLDTGIGKRDKDMRKTLETDDYPFAEFFGVLDRPAKSDSLDGHAVRASGKFKVHGIERELTVDGVLIPEEDGLRLQASWTLNLEDYDVRPPRLLIVKVDPVQKISIDILLLPEEGDAP